ncbi:MAG: hypothetical protein R8M38_07955, partial [Mariprofundaceae bacterium]
QCGITAFVSPQIGRYNMTRITWDVTPLLFDDEQKEEMATTKSSIIAPTESMMCPVRASPLLKISFIY